MGLLHTGHNPVDQPKAGRAATIASPDALPDQHAQLRAAKFGALSDLFRLEPHRLGPSIRTLMQPCPGVAQCPVTEPAIVEAGRMALEWARDVGDTKSLSELQDAVFGEWVAGKPKFRLPARAELYLSDGAGDIERQVEEAYDALGFQPPLDDGYASHIVNELSFVSYLLDKSALGDVVAENAARDFVLSHLLKWAVIFSAATYKRAEHPVTRLAGLMLEHLLFCQAEHLRPLRTRVPASRIGL